MHKLLIPLIATFCLILMLPSAQAKPPKTTKAAQPAKERLVLMPLRVGEEIKSMQGEMETALVQGLEQKYQVFSGDRVMLKVKEIFNKESKAAKKDCDETRCMEGIAMAFQSDLIASASVNKIEGGYLLSLNIRNVEFDKAVFSNSVPCKGCDAFQVIEKLKELSGAPAQAAAQAPAVAVTSEPVAPTIKATDTEGIQWGEVQKGNSLEDYDAYLSQYPKGKYVVLAKSKIKKLKEQEAAALTQQDQSTWESANRIATEASYQGYLSAYPQGSYASLATARIAKLKKESAAVEAKQKREAAEAATRVPQAGKVFKDCADCPDMVVVPAGIFSMGGKYETPVHNVTIGKAFAMGKTEITQGQWKAVMGSNPSGFSNCGDSCPVEKVSWDDAKEFIQKLNAKTGKQYRLPSEAEWEYACRAGGQSEYCGGDNVDSVAWYGNNGQSGGNSGQVTHPVGTKQANAFGLYDMSGNVWEWIEDSYHRNSYNGAPTDGTVWEGYGVKSVRRGGSWFFSSGNARSASRSNNSPSDRVDDNGFRVVRMLP